MDFDSLWPLCQKVEDPVAEGCVSPSTSGLLARVCGMIVLNAELKSRKSSLTYEYMLSRWVRAEWMIDDTASDVERFFLSAYWSRSRLMSVFFLLWTITSCSKHFMTVGMRATGR